MLLFVIAEFFKRRRRRRRADDPLPAGPLLRVLIFWVLFGIGALTGGVAIVAAMVDSWIACVAAALAASGCLTGAVIMWHRLNRLD